MAFSGAGTRSSPIAFVDSEDEAHELYKDSNHSSRSSLSVTLEKPPLPRAPPPPEPRVMTESHQPQPQQWDGKRKRTHSFVSHDGPVAGPSAPQRSYATLENRLSQPESKKARKRRRRAERQALEDTRIQNLNYGLSPFTSGGPILPLRPWSSDAQMFGGFPPLHYPDPVSLMQLGLFTGFAPPFTFTAPPEPNDLPFYDNREPHSASPPPPPSHWVSSMAKAASDSIDLPNEEHDEMSQQWSPWSTPKSPLPSSLPLPLPPHTTTAHNNNSRLNSSTLAEHHALPPKPPPPQTTIGMKPDQDPNSKHGVFQLASTTKEAGTNVKKKGPLYMPNPACTLVMEQLPKSCRQPDFINSWSKRACGALPVHMFIDGTGGKALIEFATAELARKAWASPKLACTHVKGKPREDLIKVWWYRVDGVGAGSGVGEIEEGEIEGDAIDKEVDQLFKKETKKEKKARLAKEREEKKVKRDLELKMIKQRHASLRVELNTSSTSSSAVPESSYQGGLTPYRASTSVSPPWSPIVAQVPTQYMPVTSDPGNRGLMEWGRPSTSENWAGVDNRGWIVQGDLYDYDCNMEVDVPHPTVRPAVQTLPLHSSLPPRPASTIVAPHPRVAPPALPPPTKVLPSSGPIYEDYPPPSAAPSPPPPSTTLTSGASSSSSTPSPRTPSEPRAMKNAPTEPSFTKRALMARQKELEEKIANSKLILAETRAATGSTTKSAIPVGSLRPADDPIPVKPSMDLGEKQAMEDKLKNLVLRSQKGKTAVLSPSDVPLTSPSISASSSSSLSSSSTSVPSPVVQSDQLPPSQLTSVSLSAHDISLEDLAVSFITQTIETIKSKPTPTPTQTPLAISSDPSGKPTTQSNNNSLTKLELVAKQKWLEQHITESKKLMNKLAQARTKEEKDAILKAMREMKRLFEDGSQPKTATTKTTTSTSTTKTSVSQSLPTPQEPLIRIWPGSHEDAGVLILSDSDSDDSCESDED